jgi:hypothetical protein
MLEISLLPRSVKGSTCDFSFVMPSFLLAPFPGCPLPIGENRHVGVLDSFRATDGKPPAPFQNPS